MMSNPSWWPRHYLILALKNKLLILAEEPQHLHLCLPQSKDTFQIGFKAATVVGCSYQRNDAFVSLTSGPFLALITISWQKHRLRRQEIGTRVKADAHRNMWDTRVEKGESSGQRHGRQRSTDRFVCTTYSVDIWRKRVSEKLCEGYKKKKKDGLAPLEPWST